MFSFSCMLFCIPPTGIWIGGISHHRSEVEVHCLFFFFYLFFCLCFLFRIGMLCLPAALFPPTKR